MRRWRSRLVYLMLLPALAAAAGILGYFTWKAAGSFAQLGEETIAQSTLLIVNEKVDRIEQQIIDADNAVFELIDLHEPESLGARWKSVAREVSPSVRSVLVLDDTGNVQSDSYRGGASARRKFLKVFFDRIVPDLQLERQPPGRLKHLHQDYGKSNYLLAYKALRHEGHRYYAIVHHDTDWIMGAQFKSLFATEEGKRLYNVIDEENRRVYGPSLARAGDYLVGRRFPTTLYGWRLQVAPKQAPLLDAQDRSRQLNQVALVAVSFGVILLGVGFVIFAGEKERRLNALKADFVANVSHELKTPLSVIRMFGDMLLSGRVQSGEKRRQYLEIICRESERLSGLIENVLDFAAVEQGKRTYEMSPGHLPEVVSGAIDAFRHRTEQEGVDIRLQSPSTLPPVLMDEQAVMLAVMNLLDNAMKYGAGTPIEVALIPHRNRVEVQVRDHGPGIPPEDLKRIFERFYRTTSQADRATGPAARGSGIGLALVKTIAEAHGGRAWAGNAASGGARVSISLTAAPLVNASEATATVPA